MSDETENRQTDNRRPNCLACRAPMQPLMRMPVRVGGPDSGFVLFRDFEEMSERIVILDTYRCPKCRRLEFFDLDLSLPNK